MRILTCVCCTAVLLPIWGLSASASPVDKSTTLADNYWQDSNSLDRQQLESIKFQLQDISQRNFQPLRGAPGLTLVNPYGFGVDGGSRFAGIGVTSNSRYGDDDPDATMGFGFGLGNAQKTVGLELSYTMASFGAFNRSFGTGGFNAKVHRQLAEGWGVALGWDGFLNIGDDNDFEDSVYITTTKLFRTKENLDSPFSRIAITAGIGNGAFRTEDAIADGDNSFNPFASLAVRVAQPVSFVTEWTGQDLGMGVSVSPLKRIPLTVNLGLRDLAGAGDGVRFVGGLGLGF